MASIVKPGEVLINSIKYPLAGDKMVHPFQSSHFAQKQVLGDYTMDSDPDLSVWPVFYDQTAGIGIEEIRAASHLRRSLWANCLADYPGHGALPRLATAATIPAATSPALTDAGVELWTDVNTLTNYTTGATTTLTREGTIVHGGTYSAKLRWNGGGASAYQNIAWLAAYQGRKITYTKWAYSGAASNARIGIYDGVGTTYSSYHAGNSQWANLTVSRVLSPAATELRVIFYGDANADAYFDDGTIAGTTPGAFSKMVDFNNQRYAIQGNALVKQNAGGTAYTSIYEFNNALTDIIPGVNNCLYIFLGDANAYYYMNSSEAFTVTDSTAAYYGITHDNLLWKINSTGTFAKAATPNAASPSWTARTAFDTVSNGTINKLCVYPDSTGAAAIYISTTKGMWFFDDTNNKWVDSALRVPLHTDNGKGLCVQNGKLYYSGGLAVHAYRIADGQVSNDTQAGPGADDGIPDSYVGSITDMAAGYYGDIYATLDASLVSSDNYSSILRLLNGVWQVFWTDGTANQTANWVGISSVYDYRLWFVSNGTPYYITLDRARRNPLKKTTSYASSGLYLSPWFDGFWPVGGKLALRTKALAKGTTATETITIKYRTDKANTDLGTGWTTHDTLVAADASVESVVKFNSSLGTSFKSIQFRIDWARGGTTTTTPDLLYLLLEYEKVLNIKWGWSFKLDCSKTYGNYTAQQLLTGLKTAAETAALVAFYYDDTARYVRVRLPQGSRTPGDSAIGIQPVEVIEK